MTPNQLKRIEAALLSIQSSLTEIRSILHFPSPEELAALDELLAAPHPKCQECDTYPADHQGLCEGCLAYRDHTAL